MVFSEAFIARASDGKKGEKTYVNVYLILFYLYLSSCSEQVEYIPIVIIIIIIQDVKNEDVKKWNETQCLLKCNRS